MSEAIQQSARFLLCSIQLTWWFCCPKWHWSIKNLWIFVAISKLLQYYFCMNMINSLQPRYAVQHQIIEVPDAPFGILTRKACKTTWKSTHGSLWLYIYIQETGKPKAMATTDMFFMISRALLIDNRHIAPCNSLLIHQVFTTIAWVNKAFFPLHSHI